MLLQHAWLNPLTKPEVIAEEDEDEEETPEASTTDTTPDLETESPTLKELELPPDVVDREVAEWVLGAIEKKRQGKMAKSAKPALHAAPLDAVITPPVAADSTAEEKAEEGSKETTPTA
jgi:mitogen-activated protein kinase kinase